MHKIDFKTGPSGFISELVCPEDCPEKEVHQEQYGDIGLELMVAVEEDTVFASSEVELKWTGQDEEAELWILPIVQED